MRAVLPQPGRDAQGLPVPRLGELPDPEPRDGEVLLRVHATALNRADLLQLRGRYPPPPGESEVPGLEAAGVVERLGPGVGGWRIGDRVMALLAGGGHAERVAAPVGQLLAVPEGWSFEEAAAIPEVALTAWTNLVEEGRLAAGQTVLVSAAASGVGTFAVQLARELGARVLVAGRTPARLEGLRALGAEVCLPLDDRLPEAVRAATDGRGAELVIDLAGGPWVPLLLACLAVGGRQVLVGTLAGATAEIELGVLLRRRLRLIGSVLRARSREEKARLVDAFRAFAAPRLADGRLRPVVDRVVPFDDVAAAYAQLERGGIWGKVVVRVAG